jgi:hypothetical protein
VRREGQKKRRVGRAGAEKRQVQVKVKARTQESKAEEEEGRERERARERDREIESNSDVIKWGRRGGQIHCTSTHHILCSTFGTSASVGHVK